MYKILKKKPLNDNVTLMELYAPEIAKKAKAGQFLILRVNEHGERIPLTIADHNTGNGSVTIIYQKVGKTTKLLDTLSEGESILDVVGPLGHASELEGYERVAVVGGGVGCAIAYPEAKALHQNGTAVDIIAGFRNKDIIILEDEMKAVCDNLYVTTDDGSNGKKGFVTDVLKGLLDSGNKYDMVIAIGPLIMMKVVSKLTKEYGIKTKVSMNPIMIDGTGMCGGCRLTVGGETKFACVDGPDFDGHEVDFDEAMKRLTMYRPEEAHECNLFGGVR